MNSDTVKNQHIVYAYARLLNGRCLLLVGITDYGWEYLKKEPGNFLTVTPPPGKEFADVVETWIVRGKDKKEIRDMVFKIAKQVGVDLHEAH